MDIEAYVPEMLSLKDVQHLREFAYGRNNSHMFCIGRLNALVRGRVGKAYRRDAAFRYGCIDVGITKGRIALVTRHKKWKKGTFKWKQVPYTDTSHQFSIPLTILSKIRVLSNAYIKENATRVNYHTGLASTQNMSSPHGNNVFLQRLYRCNFAVLTQYRECMLSCLVNPFSNPLASLHTNNINMSSTGLNYPILLRATAARERHMNPFLRCGDVYLEKTNNNAATCDTVISSVHNTETYKNRAKSTDCIFPIRSKKEFKTHKTVIKTPSKHLDSNGYYDQTIADQCTCTKCSELKEKTSRLNQKPNRTKKYDEFQIHDRSINCSAIDGLTLLKHLAFIHDKLLRSPKEVKIDMALVMAKACIEDKSNALISPELNDFVELLCWKHQTIKKHWRDQYNYFNNHLRHIVTKFYYTRHYYSMAPSFCFNVVRGSKLFVKGDQALSSHKYKNEKSKNMFESVQNPSRHAPPPRRNSGIVWRSMHGTQQYTRTLKKYNMRVPDKHEY